jgi:hypothetical protein
VQRYDFHPYLLLKFEVALFKEESEDEVDAIWS